MKSKTLFFFLFFLFTLSLVSSVEISVKESVKLGENFIVKVSGSFVRPLVKDNIHFYRGHVGTSMGNFNLEQIEGDYYLFLEIPSEKIPDNYSVVLEDIEYKVGRDVLRDDISKSFEIKNETVPFSVSPPLIIAPEKYSVDLQNLLGRTIEVELVREEKTSEEIVDEGSVESGGFLDALFGLFESTPEVEEENETNEEVFVSTNKIVLKSSEIKTLEYISPEKKGFEKLEFYFEGEVYGALVYNPYDRIIEEPASEENETIEFEENETIEHEENQTVENETEYNFTDGNFTSDNETELNETSEEGLKACEAAGGKVCKPNEEICSGETKYAKGVKCCMAECEVVQKSSSGKMIGWGIIITIVLFITWFLKKKYSRAGPGKIDLLSFGKKD